MNNIRNNEPIRVLHVIGTMNRGGAETMIMNLFRSIDREKVVFDFVEHCEVSAAYDDEITRLGGKIYRCPRYTGKNHFAYIKWWKSFFNEHACDYKIVHGHIGSTAAIFLSIAKQHGLYTIAHSHNTDSTMSFRELIYKLYSYRTRSVAQYFFACSEKAGKDRFGVQIAEHGKEYRVLKNAIDVEAFRFCPSIREQMRRQQGILKESFVVGHVGRFYQQKNHLFLIDVFYEISKTEPNAKLLLVGDGPMLQQIADKVKSLGLENTVCFTGVRSDVNKLMQAMDALVFPSLNEGLPVTLVEAQSAGLPCIISDCIPKDAIITHDLVSTLSLNDSPKQWADCVLARGKEVRTDHSEEIKAAGFDIHETAKWLEDFYLDKAK